MVLKRFVFSFLCLLFANYLQAQITASPTEGCAPLDSVQFSAPAGATNINWDFDDGSSSPLADPLHNFTDPGVYTVVFTGEVSGSPVEDSIDITIHPKPTPDFTSTTDSMGCLPLPVDFESQSTGGGGTAIVDWEWTFGDGGSAVGTATPSYTFTLEGAFDVSLIVTDENGCDSSITKEEFSSTSYPPDPVISTDPSPAVACNPPLDVDFDATGSTTNSTTGTDLTYLWIFEDSSTSTQSQPTRTYSDTGYYTVKLIVYDDNGCPDSTTVPVTIANPVASFSVSDTVCEDAEFANNSTGGSSFSWDFGDGNLSSSLADTVYHTYSVADTSYEVTLTATSGACSDDTTITVFVEEVIADFTSSPGYACEIPLEVNYTDLSVNAVSWEWSFGNDSTSTDQNPTTVYTDRDTNRFVIFEEQTYMDQLVVTSPHGCTDSKSITPNVTLHFPTALFMPDIVEGCVPLQVTFSDSSQSNENIADWEWHFDDGTVSGGTDSVIIHTYTSPGEYYPQLVITNDSGCKDTSYAIHIRVGDVTNPDFTASTATTCPEDSVTLTDNTPAADSVDTWHFSHDNITIPSCPEGTASTNWAFNEATGLEDITLTTGYNGCYSDTTMTAMIDVEGPVGRIADHTFHCDSPMTYTFYSNLMDVDEWYWDFGDGVIDSTQSDSVTHTYDTTGNYVLKLISKNSGTSCGVYEDSIIVKVRDIKAGFVTIFGEDTISSSATDSLFMCAGNNVSFVAADSLSQDVYANSSTGYYIWYFEQDAPPFRAGNINANHQFDDGGTKTVTLTTRDINGCWDTAYQKIRVNTIEADYELDTTYGCLPFTVNYTDSSFSDTVITDWLWEFGDGNSDTLRNTSHTYQPGAGSSFSGTLTVTDTMGCTDDINFTVTPSIPDTEFVSTSDKTVCFGDSLQFIPNSQDTAYTYIWDYGDNETDTINGVATPYHTYDTAGSFSVTLTVIDSIGCTYSKTRNGYVSVHAYPDAQIYATSDTLIAACYPIQITFIDSTTLSYGTMNSTFYDWDLGTGGSIISSPQVSETYDTPGEYDVSLVVKTTYGCVDTAFRTISVQGPVADFDMSVTAPICQGDSITFTIKDTSDVVSWTWDFGDGETANDTSPVTHQYNFVPVSGQTVVSLIASSDACTAPAKKKTVSIYTVIADFYRNGETATSISATDTAHCLNVTDDFADASTNADSWEWSFGDGGTATGQNPGSHTYPSAGLYDVELRVANSTNECRDTTIKTMIIYPLPDLSVGDADTCRDDSVQLSAVSLFDSLSYAWQPTEGLSSPAIPDPLASPDSTETFTITVTDTNNCKRSEEAEVVIYQSPSAVTLDTTIIIGDTVEFNESQGADFTYSWEPSDYLNCTDCPDPDAQPLEDIEYTLTIGDTVGCFSVPSTYNIEVLPEPRFDVPQAFSPNGDGTNDVLFVRGWGIKELVEFKVYNRWGQLVYENPGNMNEGWDGTFRGKEQNSDTYTYTVVVKSYIDEEPITANGFVTLVK